MSNLFKESIKFRALKAEHEDSPLCYELPKKTTLTEKQKGKYGILGTSKLEKTEGDEKNGR
jgi:hypothetical protein